MDNDKFLFVAGKICSEVPLEIVELTNIDDGRLCSSCRRHRLNMLQSYIRRGRGNWGSCDTSLVEGCQAQARVMIHESAKSNYNR